MTGQETTIRSNGLLVEASRDPGNRPVTSFIRTVDAIRGARWDGEPLAFRGDVDDDSLTTPEFTPNTAGRSRPPIVRAD